MAPSPAAQSSTPRTEGRAEVIASAAAVFGALDLLDEIATAATTRAHSRSAREAAEAALAECGLTHEELEGRDIGPGAEVGSARDDGTRKHTPLDPMIRPSASYFRSRRDSARALAALALIRMLS